MENMLPKVGCTYKFYDDGKITSSRRYDAKVIRIIPKEEAKSIMFPIYCCEDSYWDETATVYRDEEPVGEKSLYDAWTEEVKHCDWVFATDTDYFIECSTPKYDEYSIWFSMDIQSSWQGGKLDVDGHLTENLKQWLEEYEDTFGKK